MHQLKTYEYLDENTYAEIKILRDLCIEHDQTSLKLELDYKLETAKLKNDNTIQLNEFLYYEKDQLIGYIGISGFSTREIEVNGMVHPDHRRQGIFTELYKNVETEWQTRNQKKMLLLSDAQSESGIGFIEQTQARFYTSENEMFLDYDKKIQLFNRNIEFRKATNADAVELSKQNQIYFSDVHEEEVAYDSLVMPEDEEKKGMLIYLAEINHEIIGKVNLAITPDHGAIYGLGVLPTHRRKGYGRQILLASLEILKAKKCQQIMLQVVVENKKALDLYLDCGFETKSTMNYYEIIK